MRGAFARTARFLLFDVFMELDLRMHAGRDDSGAEKQPVGLRSPPLLLHVDDDEDVAFLLRRAFAKQMDHWSLLHCDSGSEALDYLRRARAGELPVPAMLLLDVKMPSMGGLEVLEWVRDNIPEVPAIMLSSSVLLEDRLRARDLGSVGYFEKSPTFSEIIEFLRSWEARQSLAQDADLARGVSRAA